MSREGSLWMGGLEPYMDETFVKNAFTQMGEGVLNVKVMRNKFTGELAGYCFIQFQDDQQALTIMHRLNGKVIPNSQPPSRFKLNHASTGGRLLADKEFSLWVGDLTPEVDDYALYKAFATRYTSIRTAKVILDNTGVSRGYGFIRFANEDEHKDALTNMNGFRGLGSRSIKVSLAIQKGHKYGTGPGTATWSSTTSTTTTTTATAAVAAVAATDYSQYYEQYWQNYAAWQNYGSYYNTAYGNTVPMGQQMAYKPPEEETDYFELVEHDTPIDVASMNRAVIQQCHDLWDSLNDSHWLPRETIHVMSGAHGN